MEANLDDACLDGLNFLQLKKKCLARGIHKAKVGECLDRASLLVLLQSGEGQTTEAGVAMASTSTSPSGSMSKDDLLKRLKQLEKENLALREGEPAPDMAAPNNEGERPRGGSIFSYIQEQTLQVFQDVQQSVMQPQPISFLQPQPRAQSIEPITDSFWLQDPTLHDDSWIATLIATAEDEGEGWRLIQQDDGVQLYQGGNDEIHLVRGRCIIPAHPGEVWAYLTRVEETLAVVDNMAVAGSCRVLEHLDPHHKTVYCRWRLPSMGMGLITDRDATWIQVEKMMPDSTGIVLARSVATPQCPELAGLVRAGLGVSGYVIRPYEGFTQAHVTFVLHIDPKFVLPTFVLNAAVKEQAMNVARLREVFRTGGASKAEKQHCKNATGWNNNARMSEDDMAV